MTIVTTKTFRSGNSQAVRLPREVAYTGEIELTIEKSGDVITMYPKRPTLKEMVDRLRSVPPPSSAQRRERIEFPKRRGL